MPRFVTGRRMMAASLVVLLPACASSPPASLVQARGEVNEAINAPPDTYSRAELDEARLKLGQAENAAQKDDTESANYLSQEALADLRLARARADAEHAQTAASNMQSTVKTLQNETSTSVGGPSTGVPSSAGATPAPTQESPQR